MVIAPHPDDETLGCGGAILRHIAEGDDVYWLIMTTMKGSSIFTEEQVTKRGKEIETVSSRYGFKEVFNSNFPTMELDTVPKKDLVGFISNIFDRVRPDIIYAPYVNDVHSDHKVVFSAMASCTKSFRYPFIRHVRIYETLSETEFGLRSDDCGFQPNLWIDISNYLEKKIGIMRLYESELGQHPFPRSEENIRALATFRGATAGVRFAEAYISIKEVIA
jgi:N-acetylglucosamine malate deacetylase 1